MIFLSDSLFKMCLFISRAYWLATKHCSDYDEEFGRKMSHGFSDVPETTKSFAKLRHPIKSALQINGVPSLSRPAITGSIKYGPKLKIKIRGVLVSLNKTYRFSYKVVDTNSANALGRMVLSSCNLYNSTRKLKR